MARPKRKKPSRYYSDSSSDSDSDYEDFDSDDDFDPVKDYDGDSGRVNEDHQSGSVEVLDDDNDNDNDEDFVAQKNLSTNGRQIKKYLRGCVLVPYRWSRRLTEDIEDTGPLVYYCSPSGRIIRSKKELAAYMNEPNACLCYMPKDLPLEDSFNFEPTISGLALSPPPNLKDRRPKCLHYLDRVGPNWTRTMWRKLERAFRREVVTDRAEMLRTASKSIKSTSPAELELHRTKFDWHKVEVLKDGRVYLRQGATSGSMWLHRLYEWKNSPLLNTGLFRSMTVTAASTSSTSTSSTSTSTLKTRSPQSPPKPPMTTTIEAVNGNDSDDEDDKKDVVQEDRCLVDKDQKVVNLEVVFHQKQPSSDQETKAGEESFRALNSSYHSQLDPRRPLTPGNMNFGNSKALSTNQNLQQQPEQQQQQSTPQLNLLQHSTPLKRKKRHRIVLAPINDDAFDYFPYEDEGGNSTSTNTSFSKNGGGKQKRKTISPSNSSNLNTSTLSSSQNQLHHNHQSHNRLLRDNGSDSKSSPQKRLTFLPPSPSLNSCNNSRGGNLLQKSPRMSPHSTVPYELIVISSDDEEEVPPVKKPPVTPALSSLRGPASIATPAPGVLDQDPPANAQRVPPLVVKKKKRRRIVLKVTR